MIGISSCLHFHLLSTNEFNKDNQYIKTIYFLRVKYNIQLSCQVHLYFPFYLKLSTSKNVARGKILP